MEEEKLELEGIGVVLLKKAKRRRPEGPCSILSSPGPLSRCTWDLAAGKEVGGGRAFPTVVGSLLCWRGQAVKYWPPWQPLATLLSNEECGAAGSVLNTS